MKARHLLVSTAIAGTLLAGAVVTMTLEHPPTTQLGKDIDAFQRKLDQAQRLATSLQAKQQDIEARTQYLEGHVGTGQSGSGENHDARLVAGLRQAHQELAELRAELAALRGGADALSRLPTAATLEPTAEQLAARSDERMTAQLALFETTFHAEAPDPNWSYSAEAQVRDGLQQAMNNTLTVQDLACNASLCRLEASLAVGTDPTEVFRSLDEIVAWDGEIFLNVDQDTGDTQAYFGRPGMPLPRMQSDAL